jgi:hypothetical protein
MGERFFSHACGPGPANVDDVQDLSPDSHDESTEDNWIERRFSEVYCSNATGTT